MIKLFCFIKKIKKGMTLLELVIAMSLTSIVLAGAGTVLFFTSRFSSKNIKADVYLNNAKGLATAIDVAIKTSENGTFRLALSDQKTNLGSNGCSALFIVNQNDLYGFDGNKFGIIDNDEINEQSAKFKSENLMYIDIFEHGKTIEFSIKYGDSFQNTLSLIEGYYNV